MSDRTVVAAAMIDEGRTVSDEAQAGLVAAKAERYRRLLLARPPIFPGVIEKVREWSASVPLAIASGAFRVEIDAVLRAAGLTECFTALVAADDCQRGKPDPEPYVRALSALGVRQPERTVAIEDSRHGLESARAAGMRTVAVTTHGAGHLRGADLLVSGVAGLSLRALDALVSASPS